MGVILNDFLSQAHATDGTIKSASISTSQLANFGGANGVAGLDASGYLLDAQVPTRLSASELQTTIDARIALNGTPGPAGSSVNVILVTASLWPPASDTNPLNFYVKVPD